MDKEKVITIIIGLVVGMGLAATYFVANNYFPNLSVKPPVVNFVSPSPAAVTPVSTDFTVNVPVDNTSTRDNPLTVAGQGEPQSKIIIFANADEKIVPVSLSGSYSAQIKLEDGENVISISNLTQTIYRHVILEIKQ